MEVIVPHDDGLLELDSLRRRFPEVRFLRQEGRRSYAGLRAAGVRAARGQIVALTEDQCIPPERWCANIVAAHAQPWGAIGGPVEKYEPDTALAWAIYLRELSSYMPPLPEGPAASLTDCNVSYKRAALAAVGDIWADAFHEPQVHAALQARGEKLWLSTGLVTYQQRTLQLRPALAERYEFGRLYGRLRTAALPGWKRLILIAGSPLLPGLLLLRVVFDVLRKRRHVRACLVALPYLALFATVWAWGELAGYLTRTSEYGKKRE